MNKFIKGAVALSLLSTVMIGPTSEAFAKPSHSYEQIENNIETKDAFDGKFGDFILDSYHQAQDENPDATEEEVMRAAAEIFEKQLIRMDKGKVVAYDGYDDMPSDTDNSVLKGKVRKVFDENAYYGFQMLYWGKEALERAKVRYDNDDEVLVDGIGDAFRHGYWMAAGTYNTTAAYAKKFGDAYKEEHFSNGLSRDMDKHNNATGRTIGKSADSIMDCLTGVTDNIAAGTFVYIKGFKLVKTNK